MSWEVRIMRSKTSFYNKRLSLNFLKRSWPLWVVYALTLMLIMPFEVNTPELREIYALTISRDILGSAQAMVYVSFFFCAVVAMVMFNYLYNSRSCGMLNSVPVRRDTCFFTAFITGLAPMLILDAVFFFIAAVFFTADGFVKMSVLWTWLAAVVMANTAFYGMAVFCAMLTGNVIVLPLVYGVLSMTATVVESLVCSLLEVLLYGFTRDGYRFTFLSPPAQLGTVNANQCTRTVDGVTEWIPGEYYLSGMNWLLIYCIAGLVLAGAALLLYRRRRMETAGDIVAVKQLKPVFKYCMAVGCALVFAVAIYDTSFARSTHGTGSAIAVTAMLPAGAFIGCYAAEMLMQKTLRVFKGNLKGFVITSCILVALAAGCEADIFGYEKWVPAADEVEYVEISGMSGSIYEPENIKAVTELHRGIIGHKKLTEAGCEDGLSVRISYMMKDGSSRARIYLIDRTEELLQDPDSDAMRLQDIMNSDEVRAWRTDFDIPVTPGSISICEISSSRWDEEQQFYDNRSLVLPAEQAYEFYSGCIVPDVEDGQLATFYVYEGAEYMNSKTNVTVYIETIDRSSGKPERYRYSSMSFQIQTDSERCLKWLEENTEFEPVPLSKSERQFEPSAYPYADSTYPYPAYKY